MPVGSAGSDIHYRLICSFSKAISLPLFSDYPQYLIYWSASSQFAQVFMGFLYQRSMVILHRLYQPLVLYGQEEHQWDALDNFLTEKGMLLPNDLYRRLLSSSSPPLISPHCQSQGFYFPLFISFFNLLEVLLKFLKTLNNIILFLPWHYAIF